MPQPEGRDWFKAVTDVTGIAAGLAALVYITGGLALQLRLGSGGVPSSVAVPQLPREFLISLGLLVVSKNPFPAKVCLTDGGEINGVFIGETDSRTYLADLAGRHPRRIISIPQSRVEGVAVGGRTPELGQISCSLTGPPVREP